MGSAYAGGAIPAFSLRKPQARGPVAALSPDRRVTAVFPSLNSHPWASLGTAAAVTSAGRAGPGLTSTSLSAPREGRGRALPWQVRAPGPSRVEGRRAEPSKAGVRRGRGVAGKTPETEKEEVRVCIGKNEKNENEKTKGEKRLPALYQMCLFLGFDF